jgi:hypothetical protein
MGMYTEFKFDAKLKKDTPIGVIGILEYMMNWDRDITNILPAHEFFQCDRWSMLFRCNSAYFDTPEVPEIQEINGQYQLSVHSSLKNYGSEISNFLDWIDPYLDEPTGKVIGHHQYEEDEYLTWSIKK